MSAATSYTAESRRTKENISYFARTIWVLWNMGLHFFAFTLLIFTLVFFTEYYVKCYEQLELGDLNELTLRITYLHYWTQGLWCVMLPLFFFFDGLMLCVLGILVNQRWVAAAWTTFMLTLIIVLQFVLSLGFVMPLFELTPKV